MKPVVQFSELESANGPKSRSLRESVNALDADTADRVADYLDEGIPVIDIMEAVTDPLDPETVLPGGSSVMTDGSWFWRRDLAYFVRQYRVYVPDELVEFIRQHEPPAEPNAADMRRLIEEVRRARREAQR